MKRMTRIVLVLFTLFQCTSNEKSLEESFFKEFLKEKSFDKERIIYPVYRADNLKQMLNHYLDRDTISEYRNHQFIVLTEEEKQVITHNLQSLKPDVLQRLAKNYTIIPGDTLDAIFNDSEREWNYFGKKYGGCIYRFSEPIFLRDGKFCVFYYSYTCGELSGEGNFSIYIKTWLGWRPYVSIYSWIS